MNPLIQQLIGEARALSGPAGVAFYEPEPHPDNDPVSAATGTERSEEKAEIRIATEILRSCVPIENGLPAAGAALERIKQSAHELLRIHGV